MPSETNLNSFLSLVIQQESTFILCLTLLTPTLPPMLCCQIAVSALLGSPRSIRWRDSLAKTNPTVRSRLPCGSLSFCVCASLSPYNPFVSIRQLPLALVRSRSFAHQSLAPVAPVVAPLALVKHAPILFALVSIDAIQNSHPLSCTHSCSLSHSLTVPARTILRLSDHSLSRSRIQLDR